MLVFGDQQPLDQRGRWFEHLSVWNRWREEKIKRGKGGRKKEGREGGRNKRRKGGREEEMKGRSQGGRKEKRKVGREEVTGGKEVWKHQTHWLCPPWLMWNICGCLNSIKVSQGGFMDVLQVTLQWKISIRVKPGDFRSGNTPKLVITDTQVWNTNYTNFIRVRPLKRKLLMNTF